MHSNTHHHAPRRGRWVTTRRTARAGTLLALFAALLLLPALLPAQRAMGQAAQPAMAKAEATIHGTVFQVDVADTPGLQAKGLGGRRRLGPTDGMLFVYTEKERHTFWMKGMYIPIDIIWLDNGRVVYIAHDVPPPPRGMPEEQLPTYQPGEPANLVLEIAAGRAKALGLEVGQKISFRFGVK